MPARASMAAAIGADRCGAGAGAVGDVDGIGQPAQRPRLAQQVVGVAGDRRRDLGGDDELARAQQLFKARSRRSRHGIRLWSGGVGAIAAGAAQCAVGQGAI